MNILAGDIGGTKTRLALFALEGERLRLRVESSFASGDYAKLSEVVREFQQQIALGFECACFGLAGPVRDQRCQTTNLPWEVDARELERELDLKRVWLINDLEATAWGISCLDQQALFTLQRGEPGFGNRCVIAAGTGLGEAGLYWDGARHRPFATEGGHTDFSPRNALELALAESLAARYGHVSWERLVSGPGLIELYRFLCDFRDYQVPAWLAEEMQEGDAAAVISAAAMEERCPICLEALNLFVTFYGAEAGNLALKHMATGGVFIGGGIAPKIISKLEQGDFIEAFNAKGRMRQLVEAMPVQVILDDRAALMGPAMYAATNQGR